MEADLYESAHALLAFQRGEDTDEALAGALLVAKTYHLIRAALTGKPASSPAPRRKRKR